MQYKNILNTSIAVIGTTMSHLIGGWDSILRILAWFIVIDYVTGVMTAVLNKELASDIGWNGLMKKSAIFLVVILAHQLDAAISQENPIFRTMTCYFYIANEGISITENIVWLGVPLPAGLVGALKKLKEENNEG